MKQTELEVVTLAFLKQYDGPCPYCGFHLKQPKSDMCSECGGTLVLSLSKPFRCSSWLLFMFGLVASIGVCIDQLGLLFAARVHQGSPLVWKWILPELILIFGLAASLVLWWKLRVWTQGLGIAWKRVIGFTGALMPLFWFNVLFWLFVLTL
jgi:hypothetical protein|tara:strand:+ start:449 stop:904 length:456 start_codon:yes stop_codon:yes gene_type:complete